MTAPNGPQPRPELRQDIMLCWREGPRQIDSRCFDTIPDALDFIIEEVAFGHTLDVEFIYISRPEQAFIMPGQIAILLKERGEELAEEAEQARVLSSPELTGRI